MKTFGEINGNDTVWYGDLKTGDLTEVTYETKKNKFSPVHSDSSMIVSSSGVLATERYLAVKAMNEYYYGVYDDNNDNDEQNL